MIRIGMVIVLFSILSAQGCGKQPQEVKRSNNEENPPPPPQTKVDNFPKEKVKEPPEEQPPEPAKPIGSMLALLEGHKMTVDLLAFSGDSKTLASYANRIARTNDATIFLWDVASKRRKNSLIGYFGKHGTELRGLALTHDGKTVVVAPSTRGIVCLDANTDKITKEFTTFPSPSTLVAITSNGKLVVGNDGGKILLWSDDKPDKPDELGEIDEIVKTLSISVDGKVLMVAGWTKTVRSWDLTTRKPLAAIKGEYRESTPCGAALSGDGSTIAVVNGKSVKHFDAKTGAERGTLPDAKTDIRAVALSPDGSLLAITEWGELFAKEYPITIWDIRTNTKLGTLGGHGKWIRTLVFSPDGSCLASASLDETVKLWKIDTPSASK